MISHNRVYCTVYIHLRLVSHECTRISASARARVLSSRAGPASAALRAVGAARVRAPRVPVAAVLRVPGDRRELPARGADGDRVPRPARARAHRGAARPAPRARAVHRHVRPGARLLRTLSRFSLLCLCLCSLAFLFLT